MTWFGESRELLPLWTKPPTYNLVAGPHRLRAAPTLAQRPKTVTASRLPVRRQPHNLLAGLRATIRQDRIRSRTAPEGGRTGLVQAQQTSCGTGNPSAKHCISPVPFRKRNLFTTDTQHANMRERTACPHSGRILQDNSIVVCCRSLTYVLPARST
jgi:hypothetical protein